MFEEKDTDGVEVRFEVYLAADSTAEPTQDTLLLREIRDLLATGHSLTRQELQTKTNVTSHRVDAVIDRLETEGEVDVVGDRVVRREITYHEDGTEAGEQIKYASGRQDATAKPKTAEGIGSIRGAPSRDRARVRPWGGGPASNWTPENQVTGVEPDATVDLAVRSTDASTLFRMTCTVQDPEGNVHHSNRDFGNQPARGRWEYVFPRDFQGPPEVIAGPYIVRWTSGTHFIQQDAFEIPTDQEATPGSQSSRSRLVLEGSESEPPWSLSPLPLETEARAVRRQLGEVIQVALRNFSRVPQFYPFNWVVCEVTHPISVPSECSRPLFTAAALIGRPPGDIVCDYPFSTLDRPLVDGAYPVVWFGRAFANSEKGQLVLARDLFHLNDGQLVVEEGEE